MVGWSSLLDYLFLPMINVLLAKIYLSALFPEVPPWVWVVTFVAILTAANLKSVNRWPTSIHCSCWCRFRSWWCLSFWWCRGCIKARGGYRLVAAAVYQPECAFDPDYYRRDHCLLRFGFDAVTTLSEETPDAARVIPKAIFLTAMYGGIIFIVASFFMQLFFPDIHRFKDPDAALPEIALYVGGKLFQSIFLCTTFVNTGVRPPCQRLPSAVRDGPRQRLPGAHFWLCASEMAYPALNVIMVGIVALSALFFDGDRHRVD